MATRTIVPESTQRAPGLWSRLARWVTDKLPRWIRYFYYLRFSILLWLFPVIMVLANSPKAARSLVSGIVTPVTLLQYTCVTFFLISGSFVALILAHVVVINGGDRFGDDPPPLLEGLLANGKKDWEWAAPVLSQFNNLYVFWYFFSNGSIEKVDDRYILLGIGGGIVLASVFWITLTAVYYLTYKPDPGAPTVNAKTLILPRGILRLSKDGNSGGFGDVLERAELPLTFDWTGRLFPTPGYRWCKTEHGPGGTVKKIPGRLYEGHFFSMIAAFGFYTLYWVLWPTTAPILVPVWTAAALAGNCLLALLVVALLLMAKPKHGDARKLWIWKGILAVLILGFAAALPLIYYQCDAERFPIFASVLILVISVGWTLGGLGFFLDRFRVPVLTLVIVALVLPRAVHWPGGQSLTKAQEEHYLSFSTVDTPAVLPTPGDVLDARLRRLYCQTTDCRQLPPDAKPTLIVVTATGGGIHAAAWTTAVLEQLEERFSGNFHDKVLLLSTVSGGSVGLYDYLRELDTATNGGQPDWRRMAKGARCSSLEAVGWGLIYFDIPKAVVPLLPYAVSPSSGAGDLQEAPLGKDRTWALRRAVARNLNDPFCAQWAYQAEPNSPGAPVRPKDPHVSHADVVVSQKNAPDQDQALTLSRLRIDDPQNPFPAFTMNTTTVEGGKRFLLSNYSIQRQTDPNPLLSNPTYSFLSVYGGVKTPAGEYVDLPLATAAQLSATFPYVSSASTLKVARPEDAVHFVDGGYYDNDGTVSAIEFIRYALSQSKLLHSDAKSSPGSAPPALRILLVEIRNSPDSTANGPLVGGQDQGMPRNVLSQVVAPLEGFWSAGHESVTGRNRNALGLLEGDFHDRLVLQHFVIDDQATAHVDPPCVPPKSVANDPLNWYLTPCQQIEVDNSALQQYNTEKYNNVQACYQNGSSCPHANQEEPPR